MKKWYLQTWFICLMIALWPTIICGVIGVVLLIIHIIESNKLKKKYSTIEDADLYYKTTTEAADMAAKETQFKCTKMTQEFEAEAAKKEKDLEQRLAVSKEKLKELDVEKLDLLNEIKNLRKDITLEYTSVFVDDNITSEEYKDKLTIIQLKQNDLIKSDKAIVILSDAAKKVVNNNVKQLLRCFNAETANILSSCTVKNIDTLRGKLQKSFEALNKIFDTDGISLSHKLLEMKLEELNLLYSYEYKKEQERQEQKAIREQMLEEEKVLREIEREKAKIEKEEAQFKSEINKLMAYLQKASDIEKQLYIDKIKELEEKLKLVEKDKENVLEREQNTRAGFVYVISNIGSFGEDVYKIGMTRRLEPMDRVKELGDASVPFEFDVHAMIFSQDAPQLENILHSTFRDYEVNKINHRKEFFKVPLAEIETVVKSNHNATVHFTQIAEAREYRETQKLSKQLVTA